MQSWKRMEENVYVGNAHEGEHIFFYECQKELQMGIKY